MGLVRVLFDEDDIEEIARAAHDAYEEAAIRHGWVTQAASRKVWEEVPESNKQTMMDAMRGISESDIGRKTYWRIHAEGFWEGLDRYGS